MKRMMGILLSVVLSVCMLLPVQAEPVITQLPDTERTQETFNKSFFSLTGFAKVSERTDAIGTSAYRTAANAAEFLKAIADAAEGKVKVIEITQDLDLGWNMLDEETQNLPCIIEYAQPTHNGFTNPTLMQTGVSQLMITDTHGLTVFSKNGATVRHAEWKLQGSSSDLVIRNLSFDEMWQWDEASDRLNISKENGWTFIKINGAKNVWIDHCSFSLAGDGNVDSENGASGMTLSWCSFGLPTDEHPDKNGMIYKTISYMEERYQAGALPAASRYRLLRDGDATMEEVMAYTAEHFKLNLNGSGDKDFMDGISGGLPIEDGNQRLRITHAYNRYTNIGCRIPFVRQGIGHLFNCYIDDWAHMELHYSKDCFKTYGMYDLSQCLYPRNGAAVGADTCIFYGADEPIAGSELQSDDWTTSYETMTADWKHRLSETYNHALIVNSRVSKVGTAEVYEGSSWDNNGENLFTSGAPLNPDHKFIWRDKSTIGAEKWSWTSVIEGVENMTKDSPSNKPFHFIPTYEKLPYTYKIVGLDEVESTVKTYAGAGVLDMSTEEWLSTSYDAQEPVKLAEEAVISAEKLSFVNTVDTLKTGEMQQLLTAFAPFDTSQTALVWESSDSQVAKVRDSGLVIAKTPGTATIKATIEGTDISAECSVQVVQPVTEIRLPESRISLKTGEKIVLKAEVLPADASNPALTWKSSNEKVAVVSEDGTVQALAKGSATITCTAADGSGKKASCRVTVSEAETPSAILPGDVNQSGTVTAEDALLVLQHAAKLQVIADPAVFAAADTNHDQTVSAADALLILQSAAKLTELE